MTAYDSFHTATDRPALVDVGPLTFLMADGVGEPSGPAHQAIVEALYGVSYAIRSALKETGVDRRVMPMEGLWWVPGTPDFTAVDPSRWQWTMMVAQAPELKPDVFDEAVAAQAPSPALDKLRLAEFTEGPCAQVLHVGPYADERPTIDRLLAFIDGEGLRVSGKHHEIYLDDPTRTAPEELRTILRYPVAPR